MASPNQFWRRIQVSKPYQSAVHKTLWFYESYLLPREKVCENGLTPYGKPPRQPLFELKKQEFTDRKRMLNPYQKEMMVSEGNSKVKHLESLGTAYVNAQTLGSFTMTYNRHEGLYGFRTQDFPASYSASASSLEYALDPDYSVKLVAAERINLKKWLLVGLLFIWAVNRRVTNVATYDRMKRSEQRAMQNTEADEVASKYA